MKWELVKDPPPMVSLTSNVRGTGLTGAIERLQPGQALRIEDVKPTMVSGTMSSLKRQGRLRHRLVSTTRNGVVWVYCLEKIEEYSGR